MCRDRTTFRFYASISLLPALRTLCVSSLLVLAPVTDTRAAGLEAAPGIGPGLADLARTGAIDQINELSKRRRLTTFFSNEQSPTYGVQMNYVNVGRGNLTFLNRDLVRLDEVPIVFGRVYDSFSSYDSSSSSDGDFGKGWKLSVRESIRRSGQTLEYLDASGSLYALRIDGDRIVSPDPHLTGVLGGRYERGELVLRTQEWTKSFRKIGDTYQLTRLEGDRGERLIFEYRAERLRRITTAHGRFIDIDRDRTGRIIDARDDAGRRASYRYNDAGLLSRVTDVGGGRWDLSYDEHGRLERVMDPRRTEALKASYDAVGRAQDVAMLHDVMTFSYAQRHTTVTSPLQQSATFWQNVAGLTYAAKDFAGALTEVSFDDRSRSRALAYNGGMIAQLTYRADGRLRTVRDDATGDTTTFEYDAAKRLIAARRAGIEIARYRYDRNGNLQFASDRLGVRSYRHSGRSELIEVAMGEHKLGLSWNALGLLSGFATAQQRVVIGYDAQDRVDGITYLTQGKESSSRYSYGRLGLRTHGSYQLGGAYSKQQAEKYDADMELTYDDVGNLTGLTTEVGYRPIVSQLYEMGDKNQLKRVTNGDGGVMTYEYDAAGRVTSIRVADRIARFEYDELGRLSGSKLNDRPLLVARYGPMDTDPATEADGRSALTTVAAPSASAVFGSVDSIAYARTRGAPYGAIRFDATMARFVLDPQLQPAPDAVKLVSLKRRALPIPGAAHHGPSAKNAAFVSPGPIGFDKPSNGLFLPPEFSSLNCYQCFPGQDFYSGITSLVGGLANATLEIVAGEQVQFNSSMSSGEAVCYMPDGCEFPPCFAPAPPGVRIDFGDGTWTNSWAGEPVTHAYASSGNYTAQYSYQCGCNGSQHIMLQERLLLAAACEGLPCAMEQLIVKIKLTGAVFNAITTTLHAGDLAVGLAKNTVTWGLNDIRTYRLTGGHVTNPQGSLLPWQTMQVNWSEYGADDSTKSDEQVLQAFIQDGLN